MDFFAKQILSNDTLLKGYRAHYDGMVDERVMTMPLTIYIHHRNDSLIQQAAAQANSNDSTFWANNRRPSFQLNVTPPIKRKLHKRYGRISKVARPMVLQHLLVGDKVYVTIKTHLGSGAYGMEYYITMNKAGEVVDFEEISFVY